MKENEKSAPDSSGSENHRQFVIAGLAHDLNNAMAVLQGALGLARQAETVTERARAILILAGALPMLRRLLDRLAAATNGGELAGGPGHCPPGEVIARTLAEFEAAWPGNLRLVRQLPARLAEAAMPENEFERVLKNLLRNAQQALSAGGEITVAASLVEFTTDAATGGAVKPGTYVLVSVSDDGPGIPPGVRARLFCPYASGKPLGCGTGLGLATAKYLLELRGGGITCPVTAKGARFNVYLPVASQVESE